MPEENTTVIMAVPKVASDRERSLLDLLFNRVNKIIEEKEVNKDSDKVIRREVK